MALGSWFDADYFAGQKLAQLGVFQQTGNIPATGTNEEKLQAVIDAYNAAHANDAAVTIESNFTACNTEGYISAVPVWETNVSPNELFDVRYYLTALAKAANDDADYPAPADGGEWTAEKVMNVMHEAGYSCWTHFMYDGLDRMIDCSSDFNTKAYIEAKAEATNQTVQQVIDQMKADGRNPVMDYFEWGKDNGIELQPVTTPVDVTMAVNGQWAGGAPEALVEFDPYAEIAEHVTIVAGSDGPYEGQPGENTQFEAVWSPTSGTSTLADTDVITGGADAYNTLAITLGKDWEGFAGIETGGLGSKVDPNVTNVGRIVINRQTTDTAERPLTFSAENISEDTHRFDLNAADTGATSLTNLSDAVNEINISGLQVQDAGTGRDHTMATDLKFVRGAKDATDDVLTIGLTNTGTAKAPAPVTWNANIETVIVNSKVDADQPAATNAIDLTAATGVKEMDIKGAADVQVQTTATTTLKTYDMHEATGKVTLNTYNLTNQQIIGGQHAEDTVGIGSSGVITASKWTGVENVVFQQAADVGGDTTFNAKDAQGIKAFWISNSNAGTTKVTNLTANEITVYQTKTAAGNTSIDGTLNNGNSTLDNITWQSQTGQDEATPVTAKFSSNADGTATVKFTGQDYLGTNSSFNFSNAAEVVIETPNAVPTAISTILTAPNATTLDITATGNMSLYDGTNTDIATSGELSKVETLTLNLTDDGVGTGDTFNMKSYKLDAIQQVTVNGGGETVALGSLGKAGTHGSSTFTVDVNDVKDFSTGDINVGLGSNIIADIDATGAVTTGNIATTTNAQTNQQGDVYLTVAGTSFNAGSTNVNISGGLLDIDLSNVVTAVATDYATGDASHGLVLSAQEDISYSGSNGIDMIWVTGVGTNSSSTINTGGGNDVVTMQAWSYDQAKTSFIDVNFVDGAVDTLSVDTTTFSTGGNKGYTVVNVEADATDAITFTGNVGDVAVAKQILQNAGVSYSGDLTAGSGFFTDGADTKYYMYQVGADGNGAASADEVTAAFIVAVDVATA